MEDNTVKVVGYISTEQDITGNVALNLPPLAGAVDIKGAMNPVFEGKYEVTPLAQAAVVLDTQGKIMLDDVTVKKIPYYETSNLYGETVYIAAEV